jgi:hypothetical protein
MKKLSLLLFIALTIIVSHSHAQVQTNTQTNSPDNSIIEKATYRLFPTTNLYNFIKLNTKNGEMWQVQWSTDSDKRFVTNLNLVSLVSKADEKNGRFTLSPTQNINTFLLIDQLDGRVWQVQWSIDPEKRIVIPIE